jgi:basic membrane protein A
MTITKYGIALAGLAFTATAAFAQQAALKLTVDAALALLR